MLAPCTMLSTFLPVVLPVAISVGPIPPLAQAFDHHRHHSSHQRVHQRHFDAVYGPALRPDRLNLPRSEPAYGPSTDDSGPYPRRRPTTFNTQPHPDPALFPNAHPSPQEAELADSGGGGGNVPLVVTNNCREDIFPGILSQAGSPPQSSGFRLAPGAQLQQQVSHDWQGRVWGRTNCSFNAQGTAAADGSGVACGTGDCGGTIGCMGAGVIPVTLAEFTLNAHGQTFYDISLVDGYNLPLGIVSLYPRSGNSTLEAIPPNLTNPVCIGTASELAPPGDTSDSTLGTNASFPLPLEQSLTAQQVAQWCPWALQLHVPTGSQTGVYTYPEGTLQRPAFDPCYSQCARTGQPQDCCTGAYQSPSACKPSIYSADAKTVCPDAYSYAFDDQTSTFIIPAGGGFEVIFCPPGRSTTILATYKTELSQLAQGGLVVGTTTSSQQRRTDRDKERQRRAENRSGNSGGVGKLVLIKEEGRPTDDENEVSYTVDGVEFRGARLVRPVREQTDGRDEL